MAQIHEIRKEYFDKTLQRPDDQKRHRPADVCRQRRNCDPMLHQGNQEFACNGLARSDLSYFMGRISRLT